MRLAYILVLFIPGIVSAATFENPLLLRFIIKILEAFVKGVIYVGTPALIVLVVWTGFLFISARGNSAGLTKAKSMALTTLIGGTVFLSLWAITQLVGNTLSGLTSSALLIVISAFLLYALYKK